MTSTVLLAMLLLGPAKDREPAPAPQPSVVKSMMTHEEFTNAGLGKLSPRELAALDAWLRQHLRSEAQPPSGQSSRTRPSAAPRTALREEIGPTRDDGCVALSGSTDVPGYSVEMDLAGSFGEQRLVASGGRLSVDLCLSETGARYDNIEATSGALSRRLSGEFSPGFGKENVPADLQLAFTVTMATTSPSEWLDLSPQDGGLYQIERFLPRECAGSCVVARVVGTWTLTGPDGTSSGPIDATFGGFGVHATATANVDASGFPKSATLDDFSWIGGSFDLPDLVSVNVAGAPLRVHPERMMVRMTETAFRLTRKP